MLDCPAAFLGPILWGLGPRGAGLRKGTLRAGQGCKLRATSTACGRCGVGLPRTGWRKGAASLPWPGGGAARRLLRRPAEGLRSPVGTGEVAPKLRGWLKAWRWLQDPSRAASASGPAAEAKVQHLLNVLGGRPPGLGGGQWEQRQFQAPGAPRSNLPSGLRRLLQRAQAEDAATRRAAWRSWVLGALQRRPGLLYVWAKSEAQATAAVLCHGSRARCV